MPQAPEWIALELTREQASALRDVVYRRVQALSSIEDHDPDPHKRAQAIREAVPLLRILDSLPFVKPRG